MCPLISDLHGVVLQEESTVTAVCGDVHIWSGVMPELIASEDILVSVCISVCQL